MDNSPTENIVDSVSPPSTVPQNQSISLERILFVHDNVVALIKKAHGDSPKPIEQQLPRVPADGAEVVFTRGDQKVATASLHFVPFPRSGVDSSEPLQYSAYFRHVILEPVVVGYETKK